MRSGHLLQDFIDGGRDEVFHQRFAYRDYRGQRNQDEGPRAALYAEGVLGGAGGEEDEGTGGVPGVLGGVAGGWGLVGWVGKMRRADLGGLVGWVGKVREADLGGSGEEVRRAVGEGR